MKNQKTNTVSFAITKLKTISAIALIAVIMFTLGSCIINVPDDTPNLSLDGTWKRGDGPVYSINGSTGVFTQLNWPLYQNAASKGYISIGGQAFRYLSKTGDRTWTGQLNMVVFYENAPNVAIGNSWENTTITMAANGRTFESTAGGTFTRY
jgi:hypothetical protein